MVSRVDETIRLLLSAASVTLLAYFYIMSHPDQTLGTELKIFLTLGVITLGIAAWIFMIWIIWSPGKSDPTTLGMDLEKLDRTVKMHKKKGQKKR